MELDGEKDRARFLEVSGDWWHMTVLIHTSQETWGAQAAAVKETWLAKPLPPGVRYFWVSDNPLPDEPALLVSNRKVRFLNPIRCQEGDYGVPLII